MKRYTLVILHEPHRILLGKKKIGMGVGFWNGFGGKVEEGEEVIDGARREMLEECGVALEDIAEMGVLEYHFDDDRAPFAVHVFRSTAWKGEPVESDEMAPAWFPIDGIPYREMWPDDDRWLPLLLKGERFAGRILSTGDLFRPETYRVLEHDIHKITE